MISWETHCNANLLIWERGGRGIPPNPHVEKPCSLLRSSLVNHMSYIDYETPASLKRGEEGKVHMVNHATFSCAFLVI